VLCGSFLLVCAGAAFGAATTGSPAALRLVSTLLAHAREIDGVVWHSHGGVYLCPVAAGQPPVAVAAGRAPAGSCRAARTVIVQRLHANRIIAELDTITAHGLPRIQQIVVKSGDWFRWGSQKCFDKIGPGDTTTIALSYRGERMTIASEHGDIAVLRGTARGYEELDTVDLTTDQVVKVRQTAETEGFGISRSLTTFSYPANGVTVPKATPVCPAVTKFS
jgi:hypothetical protein